MIGKPLPTWNGQLLRQITGWMLRIALPWRTNREAISWREKSEEPRMSDHGWSTVL
jgi:hypothetical protein